MYVMATWPTESLSIVMLVKAIIFLALYGCRWWWQTYLVAINLHHRNPTDRAHSRMGTWGCLYPCQTNHQVSIIEHHSEHYCIGISPGKHYARYSSVLVISSSAMECLWKRFFVLSSQHLLGAIGWLLIFCPNHSPWTCPIGEGGLSVHPLQYRYCIPSDCIRWLDWMEWDEVSVSASRWYPSSIYHFRQSSDISTSWSSAKPLNFSIYRSHPVGSVEPPSCHAAPQPADAYLDFIAMLHASSSRIFKARFVQLQRPFYQSQF